MGCPSRPLNTPGSIGGRSTSPIPRATKLSGYATMNRLYEGGAPKSVEDHLSLFRDHAMRRFRFHLGTLVILVLLLGVGFAALRESNEIWDTGIFSITLGVLLISVLLATHRTEKRRAIWLGFALFGSAYLGFTLVPQIESRLITTGALTFLDSKMPRSIPIGLAYADFDNDGKMDLYVANNSQPNTLFRNKGKGTFEDVTSAAGVNTAWFSNIFLGTTPKGSSGTTEHFVRIGHSLLALIAAFLGGLLSRHRYAKNRERDSGLANPHA
jgi:VCBS repeat protein